LNHPEPSIRTTSARYLEMAECGLISPDDRVELLDGLIVSMSPPSPPHDSLVQWVQYTLLRRLGLDVIVRVQAALELGASSVPQPDIAVVPGRTEDYLAQHPTTAHLVVEVSVSSLAADRSTKAAIYARAGIASYWIVNCRDRVIEVHEQPDPAKARFHRVVRASERDVLTIPAFPDFTVEARELFPSY
jgi:Uma2 family endonuclease